MIITGEHIYERPKRRKYASELNELVDFELCDSIGPLEPNSHDCRDHISPELKTELPSTKDYSSPKINHKSEEQVPAFLERHVPSTKNHNLEPSHFTEELDGIINGKYSRILKPKNELSSFKDESKLKLNRLSFLYEQERDLQHMLRTKDHTVIVNYQVSNNTNRKKHASKEKLPPSKTLLRSISDVCVNPQISDSHVTARRFLEIRNKASVSGFDIGSGSTSLYVDPFLGCNQDCTGTKMRLLPESPSNQFPILQNNMDNASTIPLIHGAGTFYGNNTLPIIHHQESPAQNFKYNFCECNHFEDEMSFHPYRSILRHEGIPHKSCRYYSACRDYDLMPFSISHEILNTKHISHERLIETQNKGINCEPCKVQEEEHGAQPKFTGRERNKRNTTHTCNCRAVPDIHFNMNLCKCKPPQKSNKHHQAERQHLHRKTAKSIGCQAMDSSNRNIEVGKNITIQIIPNGYHKIEHNQCDTIPHIPANGSHKTESTRPRFDNFPEKPVAEIEVIQNNPKFQDTFVENRVLPESSSTEQRQYWWACSWLRKKDEDPYYRRQKKHHTGTDATKALPEPAEYKEVETPPTYGPFPFENVSNKENLLKSLHRMNKGLIRDLFATPCPSSSSACPRSCVQKIRGAPYPMCSGDPTSLSSALKPVTANQYSQSEPKTQDSPNDLCRERMFFECMKYLMNRVAQCEECCEYEVENDDCWCCCQSYNCCHCQVRPICCRCCRPEKKIACNVGEKKCCPCTCSRIVEVKQSVRDFGVNVSPVAIKTKVAAVNTEPESKITKQKKCRCCCRPRCCQCCKRPPICCCEQSKQCCDGGAKFDHFENIHDLPMSKQEHMVFCCQCENNIPKYLTKTNKVPESKTKSSSTIVLETKCVGTTKNTSTKPTQYIKMPSNSRMNTATNEELYGKSYIDDTSKLEGPSQRYSWDTEALLAAEKNDRYTSLNSEETYQIPSYKNLFSKSNFQQSDLPSVSHGKLVSFERNENFGCDVSDDTVNKIQYLSGIFEAIMTSREKNIDKSETNIALSNSSMVKDAMFPISNEPNKRERSEVSKSDKSSETEKIPTKVLKPKSDNAENNMKNLAKLQPAPEIIESKIANSTKDTHEENRSQSSSANKPTLSNMYTSKPFTTKTGLMSYIPPNRDSFLNYSTNNEKTPQKPCPKKDMKSNKRASNIQSQSSIPRTIKTASTVKGELHKTSHSQTTTSEEKENKSRENINKFAGKSETLSTTLKKHALLPKKGDKCHGPSTVRKIESKKKCSIPKKSTNQTSQLKFYSSASTPSVLNSKQNFGMKECKGCVLKDPNLECHFGVENLRDFLFLS